MIERKLQSQTDYSVGTEIHQTAGIANMKILLSEEGVGKFFSFPEMCLRHINEGYVILEIFTTKRTSTTKQTQHRKQNIDGSIENLSYSQLNKSGKKFFSRVE